MSMLVDVSYFISGPRQIRNATTAKMPTAEGLSANNVIYGYIRSFQRKCRLHACRSDYGLS